MIWTLSLAAKSTLVLGAATMAAWALRRSSASMRHAMWVLALSSLLALPVLSVTLPALGVPVLPAPGPGFSHALKLVTSPLESAVGPLDAATAAPSGLSWWDWALLTWLAGVGLGWSQLASGTVFAAIAVRRARPITSPEWSSLLREAGAKLGVRRRVSLRVSSAVGVPMVWGYQSPIVLLPPEAMDWPRGRQRAVLLHEMAHVARRDCLTQTLAYGRPRLLLASPAGLVGRRVAAPRARARLRRPRPAHRLSGTGVRTTPARSGPRSRPSRRTLPHRVRCRRTHSPG